MPQSENHAIDRARAHPKQESRPRVPSTDRRQTTSGPAAVMRELQHPCESGLGGDFSQSTFERHAALLGDPRLRHPTAAMQRALLARQIQRDYGNRYVQRLVDHISQKRAEAVQTKLAVGEYEQEADRVAKQVVGMAEPSAQRQAGLEEEEMVQAKPDGPAQRQGELEEEELQMKAGPGLLQRQGMEEEELLQGKFAPVQREENKTGLPANLKSGIENLSGHSMDDVKVHYNSSKPAELQALAYAQGTDIHVGPGQEEHLPHEAWHVVQQKQGRVKPTMQMKGGVNINNDTGLESQADSMGAKALNMSAQLEKSNKEIKIRAVPDSVAQKKRRPLQAIGLVNDRLEATKQKGLQRMTTTNVIQRECTHPSGISISDEKEVNDSKWVGMSVDTNVHKGIGPGGQDVDPKYVSGDVQVSEQVGEHDPSGAFEGVPIKSINSKFMPITDFPVTDEHAGEKREILDIAVVKIIELQKTVGYLGAELEAGSVSVNQNFIWKHPSTSCTLLKDPDDPNKINPKTPGTYVPAVLDESGYEIKHVLWVGPGYKVTVVTTKSPKAVDLNGYDTSAGVSGPVEETVVIQKE